MQQYLGKVNIEMTLHELELYRKCMRKKKRSLTRKEYEESHEYNTEINDSGHEKE